MRVVIAHHQVLLRAGLGRLFADGVTTSPRPLGDVDFMPAVVSTHRTPTSWRSTSATTPLAALTERERTMLQLMAEGLTNTGIAKRLHLSERAVEAPVRHLLNKLHMPDSEEDHRRVHAVPAT